MFTLAFDADDTLWRNEDNFQHVHRAFERLLAPWADITHISDRLHDIQMENLSRFGYGAKSFTLSMIEASINISDGEINSTGIMAIVELGKELIDRPVELLDGVTEVLDALDHHRLMVITKGDPKNQRDKIRQSGLADRFWQIEVVATKNSAVYTELLRKHNIDPAQFVMVGNSLPSDVLPVLEIGGRAVHVPYHVTARHELHEPAGTDSPCHVDVPTLSTLRDLPALLSSWDVRA